MERLAYLLAEAFCALGARLWCHRASYAALGLNYGLGCLGLLNKESVAMIATGLYLAIWTQRH